MALISERLAGLAAAALLGASVLAAPHTVSAQATSPAAPPAPSPGAESAPPPTTTAPTTSRAPRSRVSRIDAYINNLHKRLMITSAQQSQWDAVAQVMRDNAQEIDRLASERAAKRGSMNAVDDLNSYEAIADAHAEGLKKLVPAFAALYDSMSDAQKKNADQVFSQRSRRTRTSRPKSNG